eukprot:GDKI01045473.1.p1 GENE.GDKI01045473.1~~GDKI01045473.1.p1  ORF type:complete len:256 (-),score=92.53 GDKI01045473.1:18-785(-)
MSMMEYNLIGDQYTGVQVICTAIACSFSFGFGVYLWWTSHPKPHTLDERERKLQFCNTLNVHILIWNSFVGLQMLSSFDNIATPTGSWVDLTNYGVYCLTCPLENYQVALLAGASSQRTVEIMIQTFGIMSTGLFASLTPLGSETGLKVAGFFFSAFFHACVVYSLNLIIQEASNGRESLSEGRSYLRRVCVIECVFWLVFPLLWVLGPEGFDWASGITVRILLMVVNNAAKIVFALYLFIVQEAWTVRTVCVCV